MFTQINLTPQQINYVAFRLLFMRVEQHLSKDEVAFFLSILDAQDEIVDTESLKKEMAYSHDENDVKELLQTK